MITFTKGQWKQKTALDTPRKQNNWKCVSSSFGRLRRMNGELRLGGKILILPWGHQAIDLWVLASVELYTMVSELHGAATGHRSPPLVVDAAPASVSHKQRVVRPLKPENYSASRPSFVQQPEVGWFISVEDDTKLQLMKHRCWPRCKSPGIGERERGTDRERKMHCS